jgi:hypothetical protein
MGICRAFGRAGFSATVSDPQETRPVTPAISQGRMADGPLVELQAHKTTEIAAIANIRFMPNITERHRSGFQSSG